MTKMTVQSRYLPKQKNNADGVKITTQTWIINIRCSDMFCDIIYDTLWIRQ